MFKRGASGEAFRPKFTIMNPALTQTLPAYQTACGITDILAHKFNITHDLAGQALVNYAMKTGKIDMIVCDYWTVHNDRTGLNAARTEDKHLSQRLIGRVYSASDQEDFRNKIFKQFYIEPNWMQI